MISGRRRTWLRSSLLVMAFIALARCKSDTGPDETGQATANATVAFVGGAGLIGAAGHALRQPVQVQVQDASAGFLAGVKVKFSVDPGEGSLSPDTATTNSGGLAETRWTLGPTVGRQTVTVKVARIGGDTVTITASDSVVPDIPGPPTIFTIGSGDAQQGAVNQQLPLPMVAVATDSLGVGVPGLTVTFTSGGDASIIGGAAGNGRPVTTSATAVTDTNGIVSFPYKLGSTLGIYSVQAQTTFGTSQQNIYFTESALNGPDQAAIQSVFVGKGPQGVAINPTTSTAYVANTGQAIACDFAPTQLGGFSSYAPVSEATDKLLLTQPTTTAPFDVVPNPANNMLYVGGWPSLEVWNGATNTLVTSLNLADSIRQIAINPATNQIWAAAGVRHAALLINGATNQVTDTIRTGQQGPHGLALNTVTNRVYTSDSASNTVTVIDGAAKTVLTHIAIGGAAVGIAVNPKTNHIFVSTGDYMASLVVIDGSTNTVIKSILLGRRLGEMAVDTANNRVYVASASIPYSIAVVDGVNNQLIGFHPTATRCPYGVAYDPTTHRVFVTSYIDNNLYILDATKLP